MAGWICWASQAYTHLSLCFAHCNIIVFLISFLSFNSSLGFSPIPHLQPPAAPHLEWVFFFSARRASRVVFQIKKILGVNVIPPPSLECHIRMFFLYSTATPRPRLVHEIKNWTTELLLERNWNQFEVNSLLYALHCELWTIPWYLFASSEFHQLHFLMHVLDF